MNRIYRVVWSRVLKQLVVASEFAKAATGGVIACAPRARNTQVRPLAATLLLLLGASAAHADVLANNSFESGDLTGWLTGGGTGTQVSGSYGSSGVGVSVVTGMTDFDSKAGNGAGPHSWTVTPYGSYMASLQAGVNGDTSVSFATGASLLGLTQSSQDEITDLLAVPGKNGPTNAAWLYQDITLAAGDSFTMAWQYVSTDYTPFNDGSLTSLVNLDDTSILGSVNNLDAQYALLGATNPGTGNYATDSYGATGWEVATYTVSTAGIYRLGFLSFNLDDVINSPVLLVDQAPGQTFDKGVPFDPIAPNPGSEAPVTPTSTTISTPTTTADLGTSDASFDGGTLVADDDTTLDQDFTVNNNGGAIDQAGHDVTVTGSISDAADGDAGTLTVTNSGSGGSVTLSGTNTYTGATDIDSGATLALTGDGSISDSSGVSANGTFDLGGHNGDVDITTLAGNGTVDLGANDLHLTDASGTFGGAIGGTGGVSVDSGNEVLGGANSYTGATDIGNGATLALGSDGSIADSSGVNADGTFDVSGHNGDVDITTLAGNGTISLGANDLHLTDASGSFCGGIGGAGGIVVDSGTETVCGANTYTGATSVDSGATLVLTGDGSIAGSSGVNADGTFDVSGHNGDVDITTLSGNGSVDLGANDLHLTDASGTFAGDIGGTGGVSIDGGTEVLGGTNTYTGGTTVGDGATVQIADDANLGDASGGLTLAGGTLHTTANVDTGRDITLVGGGTVQTGAGTVAIDHGDVAGTGDFVKTGDGTLVVAGSLSQDGGVQVQDGTLALGGTDTYTGATSIDSGATLALTGNGSITDSSGVSANGTFDLGGHNGNVDITTLSGNGSVDLGANDLHLTDASGSFCGGIGGAGGIAVDSGTETVCGANTYTGATSVDSGATLVLTGDGSIAGSSGVNADGTFDVSGHNGDVDITTLSGNGSVDLGANDLHLTDASGTFAGDIGGAGSISIDGGTEVLGGTNTYTGGTTVGDGATVQIADDANLGDASGGLTLAGGTLHTTGDIDTNRGIHLGSDGSHLDTAAGTTVTAHGNVDGGGALVKDGAGTLALDGIASHHGGTVVNDGTLVLAGDNTYTGGTTLNGGTLQIDRDANLGDAGGNLTFNGGTLHTTGDLDTARDATLQTGGGTLAVDHGTTATVSGTLAGSGGLVKSGDGVLALTGDNTYSGGTIIAAGTLRGDAGSVQGDIVANGTLDFTQGGNGTFVGALGGTGNLVKNGSGTLTISGVASHQGGTVVNDGTLALTGNNRYTGGTALNGGVLQVGSDANLGDGSSALAFNGGTLHTTGNVDTARDITLDAGNGTIVTDAGTVMSDSGDLGGSGGLIKNGSGRLELTGTASHHGGTVVNAGTLVLAGTNSYTGGTTLNGGSLRISRDANLGDASGDLVFNGGDLTVTGSMATDRNMRIDAGNASITTLAGVVLTANGDLSGTGGLVKHGGGTLVVSGANTFSGGTVIDGGDVVIDTGSSLGTGTILLDGGTLHSIATLGSGQTVMIAGSSGVNVDAGTTIELSGQLLTSGATGCFVKSGAGTLNMTGSASLDHGTCVQEGMLRANGDLASRVWVDAAGTLRGIGRIRGDLDVHGVLAPGNSPGTLTVAGDVTLHDDATYQVDIDGYGTGIGAGNYSRLLVVDGHSFTAGGTLAPTLRGITGNASNTFVPAIGDRFLVVQADGGIVGRFASLAQPTAGLDATERFQAFYTTDGRGIELAVTPVSYRDFLNAAGANGNARRVGDAVDALLAASDAGTATSDQQTLLNRMANLTSDQVAGVAVGLAGEVHAREAAAAHDRYLGLASEVGDHLADGVAGQDGRHDTQFWANLGRDGSRFVSDGGADGFKTSQNRSTLGLDAWRGDAALVGIGVTHVQTQLLDNGGSGDIRGNAMFAYGQVQAGVMRLDGLASKSADHWSTKRIDPLLGSQLTARADGHTTMGSLTASLPMKTAQMSVAPFVRAVWQRVERDGFSESGEAAERLTVDRYAATGSRLMAGVDLGSTAKQPLDARMTYHAALAVGHDAGGLTDASVGSQLDDVTFRVDAPRTGRNFIQLDLNGTLRLSHNAYLYGGVTSQTGKGHSSYAATTGIRVAF